MEVEHQCNCFLPAPGDLDNDYSWSQARNDIVFSSAIKLLSP